MSYLEERKVEALEEIALQLKTMNEHQDNISRNLDSMEVNSAYVTDYLSDIADYFKRLYRVVNHMK